MVSQLDYICVRGMDYPIYFSEASYHESNSANTKQIFIELQLNPGSREHRTKKAINLGKKGKWFELVTFL